MTCSCGRTLCECGDVCHCCPFMCLCSHCFLLRLKLKEQRHPCDRLGTCPLYTKPNIHRTHRHRCTASDKRKNMGTFIPDAQQDSSTAPRGCAHETSHSPPRESPTFGDDLIFRMDDFDISPEVPRNASTNPTTGAKSKICLARSHFSSNTNVSGTPFEQREMPSRGRRCYLNSPDADHLKWTESTKCKMPISVTLEKSDASVLNLRESRESEIRVSAQDDAGSSHDNPGTSISDITGAEPLCTLAVPDYNRTFLEREMPTTTENVPGCSHHNPTAKISKLEESLVIAQSSGHKLDATDMKWTELNESEMMITKDIAGCSYDRKNVTKQQETRVTGSVFYAASSSTDKYVRHSLPSNLHSGDPSPSSFQVSPQSPTHRLSISASSVYDLPQATEIKSSEQKTSTILSTPETSPTSDLSKFLKT